MGKVKLSGPYNVIYLPGWQQIRRMKTGEFINKNLIVIIFTLAGLVAGFLYWKFIGCLSGTCRIKSVWYLSTLYGGIAGYLAGDITASIIKWFRNRKKGS